MKQNKLRYIILFIFLLAVFSSHAQKTKSQKGGKKASQKTSAQPAKQNTNAAEDEKKVRDIIAFLQYMLNTVGSSATAARDKDVLITESYSKIFRDSKVQVEDDLDEERQVITNKDIVAYLKDVDFFFNDAKFEYTIEDIKSSTLPGGDLFYKVSARRSMTATTPQGRTVTNTIPRFIEINYNPDDQDLKIVSMYTKEFDEREALTSWWKELSYEWQSIFKRKLNLTDSVNLNDLKNITAIEELDLSNNQYVTNIEPIAQLISLKLLNLAGTQISDLTPIRNLTELVELNLAETRVFDLSPLRYSTKMLRLNIDNTEVRDIAVVEQMPAIQNLEMQGVHIIDFAPVGSLTALLNLNVAKTQLSDLSVIDSLFSLIEINVSATQIEDLSPIQHLVNLTALNIDSTMVSDISVLSALENLKVLHANYTRITALVPLEKIPALERVYCDQTPVTRDQANAFVAAKPGVLVIFDTKDLKSWWDTLPSEWRVILSKTAKVSQAPSNEELAKITNVDSISFRGNSFVNSLEPLRRLIKLQVIIADKTPVYDLSPLSDHQMIRYLDISDTRVTDISILENFTKLQELHVSNTQIGTFDPLFSLRELKRVYADGTVADNGIAKEFLKGNPACLFVFKTDHLRQWWTGLSAEWRELFKLQMGKDTTITRESLHMLVEKESLSFRDVQVSELAALKEFVRLRKLQFSGTAITTIPALENLLTLKTLHATNSPLKQVESLSQFKELEELDISNTPVDELGGLASLEILNKLNCAGTQIKKLDPLEKLQSLEALDCSNTKVKSLEPLSTVPLKTLKCYNTKVSSKEVQRFKKRNADCVVTHY